MAKKRNPLTDSAVDPMAEKSRTKNPLIKDLPSETLDASLGVIRFIEEQIAFRGSNEYELSHSAAEGLHDILLCVDDALKHVRQNARRGHAD